MGILLLCHELAEPCEQLLAIACGNALDAGPGIKKLVVMAGQQLVVVSLGGLRSPLPS